jgi:hypothetical protein
VLLFCGALLPYERGVARSRPALSVLSSGIFRPKNFQADYDFREDMCDWKWMYSYFIPARNDSNIL